MAPAAPRTMDLAKATSKPATSSAFERAAGRDNAPRPLDRYSRRAGPRLPAEIFTGRADRSHLRRRKPAARPRASSAPAGKAQTRRADRADRTVSRRADPRSRRASRVAETAPRDLRRIARAGVVAATALRRPRSTIGSGDDRLNTLPAPTRLGADAHRAETDRASPPQRHSAQGKRPGAGEIFSPRYNRVVLETPPGPPRPNASSRPRPSTAAWATTAVSSQEIPPTNRRKQTADTSAPLRRQSGDRAL